MKNKCKMRKSIGLINNIKYTSALYFGKVNLHENKEKKHLFIQL